MLTLYSYYRSSAAYRIRIALNIKAVEYKVATIDLLKDGGEQHSEQYLQVNPQGMVPALATSSEILTQSMAILEWLEEQHPNPPLLPIGAAQRAQVRAMAQVVCCDIHPLNNLRVRHYLADSYSATEEQRTQWMAQWINRGFSSIETNLRKCSGKYCFGNQLSMADCCLIPQVYNAKRLNISLQSYPTISAINAECLGLAQFIDASPEQQLAAID